MRDDIGIWILAGLIILVLSSVILYVEPSFPRVVLGVYIVEVIMYANLFIDHKRFQKFSMPKTDELSEIIQLEKDG